MKKIIIINNKDKNINREQISIQEYNLVLADNSSIIDLPSQIRDALINNDKVRFKVISWCMFPIIWAGDIIKIEPIKPENAKIGDIVLYKYIGRAYAHRLVKRYEEHGKLYIVTSGERKQNNQFNNLSGIPADNILGKVIEVKRGKLCFRPADMRLSLGSLIQGRLKLSVWTLIYNIKQYIAKILIRLQGVNLYRCFFRRLIENKISFFVGVSLTKKMEEINNFYFYRRFDDFSKDSENGYGLYNISARINNKPVGNIGLSLERISNCKVCTLSNFIVRIPYRSGGIGCQLIEKALCLCNRFNIDEIKVTLFKEDKVACNTFLKLGFRLN